MILINPKIIRDISKNLNTNYFDMCIESLNGGGGSPYKCIINDDGSISIEISNTDGNLVTMNFNGSNYVSITCTDGKFKIFKLCRRTENNLDLEQILLTKFSVDFNI